MTLREKLNASLNGSEQKQNESGARSLRDQISERTNTAIGNIRSNLPQYVDDRGQTQPFSATPFTGIDARVAADKTAAQRRNRAVDEAVRKQYGISSDEYKSLFESTEAAQKYVDDLQRQYRGTSVSSGGRHFEPTSEGSFMGIPNNASIRTETGASNGRNVLNALSSLVVGDRSNYSEKAVRGQEEEHDTIAKRLQEANAILEYRKFKDQEDPILKKYNVDPSNEDYAELSSKQSKAWRVSPIPEGLETTVVAQARNGKTPAGMTDEQAANLRYIANKYGQEAAKEYAKLFEDIVLSEDAANFARSISEAGGVGKFFGSALYGTLAGFSQFGTGIANTVSAPFGQTVPDAYAKGNAIIRESIDNVVGRGAYDLVVTTANMVPSIVLSAVTGVPALGTAAMGTSAGGNAYAQAVAEGKPAYQAIAYGVLNGVSEACLQSIIGGISPLASEEGVTEILTKKISQTLGKKAAQEGAKTIVKVLNKVAEKAAIIGTNALFEGGEEYLQDILEPVFRNICFNENNEFKPFTEEALYSGIIGALSGGMFSGIDVAKNDVISGALKYSTDAATKGETALQKALSGETLTDAEVKAIAQDYTYRKALSREAGVDIMGTNSERRSLVKKAVETIQQRANVAANTEAANADTNATATEESAIDLARQATAGEAAQTTINPTENAQNINVSQNGSQRVTEGIGENTDARIADFANPQKNYTRTADTVNTQTGTVNDDGSITYTKSDGTTDTFRSLRDISDMLMDNLGFNFVGKLPSIKGVAGYYMASENMIHSMYNDVSTIAHEVGHWLDTNLDLQSKLNVDELERLYGKDVRKADYSKDKVGRELIAELTREYFRNSAQLKADHPEIYNQFETALKEAGGNIYDTIRTAADMFNAYTSLAEEQRYKTKITDTEIEKKRKKDAKTTSMREKVNKFLYNFFDSALPLKIGSEEAYVLQTEKNGNLPMVIQSAVVDGVRNEFGDITAEGWSKIYDTLTEGLTEKEAAPVRKAFNEYLLLLDIQDSLTIGQRYDEPTRVSKTLEAADRTRVIEAKNNINNALAALQNADYKSLRGTLNNLITDITYSADVRKALIALERALPRYDRRNAGAYTLQGTDVTKLIGDLAKQVKALSAEDLAKLQSDIGKVSELTTNKALAKLVSTLADLVTRVDEDAIKQNVFTTETYLNDAVKTQQRIDEILAENPNFAEAKQMVRDWYDALQQLMVDSGIWTEEQVANLRKLHPNYIGLHRAVDMSEKRTSKTKLKGNEGKGFQVDTLNDMLNYTRKGSDKEIYDAFEQACFFANNVIQRVTNNSIIEAFYRDAISDKTIAFEDLRMAGGEQNALTFYENGKEHHFYVNDPLILAALKWEKPSIGGLQAVRMVTNLTKKFATQYNPAFVVRNVIRDVQQAYRNGSEDNVIKFAGQWFSALYDVIRKTPEFEAAQAAGLEGAAPWRGMTSQAMNTYKTEVGLAKKNAIQKAFNAINDVLTYIPEVTETATRYAEVKRQLQNDPLMTVSDAVLEGQELTTNFTRQGASRLYRILDTFIPFLSANVQGTYNNIKQIVDYDPKTGKVSWSEDGKKKLAKTIGIWAIPAILQYALLYMDFGDGEDRERKLEAFKAETNFIKNTYWLVWLGDDTFLKLPKSQILNPAFAAIERLFDTLAADDPQAFGSFLDYMVNNILLGQFTDLTNITGIGTVIALASNKDWRGQAIDTAKEYNQKISPRYHYDENTSFAAKWLGNIINVSPQQIDYVVGDVLPFVGSLSKDLTSEKALKDIRRNPVEGIFSALGLKSGLKADSVYSTDIKREYYNYKDKVNTTANDAKNVFTPETSESKAKKFGSGLAQNTNYSVFHSQIVGTINNAIKAMDDPSEKRSANKTLNQLMTALSGTHGETAKGGTQLDKDIAALYSDYSTYSADIGDTNLGYWLSQVSANGKTYKVKDIVKTDDPVQTVENAVKYYAYVDKMLNDEWDAWTQTAAYKAASNKQKLDKYLNIRKKVCYSALKQIESENK